MNKLLKDIADSLNIPYKTQDQNIWLLRTKSGHYYRDFNLNNYVALGWDRINKETIIGSQKTDDNIKETIKQLYPDESRPGLILGQLKTFYNQMKPDDFIVIPSKNSESLSIGVLGELIEDVEHIAVDEEYVHCKYMHKRSVKWTNQIIPVNDIYISRVLKSHQTITNISEYSNVLYRNIFPLYIDDSSIHLTLQKISKTEMKLVDNIILQNTLYNIIFNISSLYSDHNEIEDALNIKTAVGSPGFIEIISDSVLAIPGLLFVVQKIFGKSKDNKGSDISGLSSIISQISSCFDAKVERDYRREEINEKKINNQKLEKELALIDIQLEKEKAITQKLKAEALSEEIKNHMALQALSNNNSDQIQHIEQQISSDLTNLHEVIERNNIQLPLN